ncbi:MAG: LytR C-terminal domain-containing protein [Actinomycetota bacterium]
MRLRPTAPAIIALVALVTVGCSSTPDAAPTSPLTSAPASTTTLPPTTVPVSTLPASTTTTSEPLVIAGAIVKIANCSDVNGAAGVLTDEFSLLGYEVRKATNGAGIDRNLDVSKIYVVEGAEAQARSISKLMGGVDLYQMPVPAWIAGGSEELSDANVLIMLGRDKAGKRLLEMAG